MSHYWIIEAKSAHDLAQELQKEIKAGAKVAGPAFISLNRKHYQPIVRDKNDFKKLDSICLEKFEIR